MELGRIVPDLTWAEFVIVRMLRRWAASREAQANGLPSLVALAQELGQETEAAVALHSLFQLAEASLGRPLEAECCCNRALSRDEQAILMLISASTELAPPRARSQIPHGLPGALCWAVASARLAMGIPDAGSAPVTIARCPFDLD